MQGLGQCFLRQKCVFALISSTRCGLAITDANQVFPVEVGVIDAVLVVLRENVDNAGVSEQACLVIGNFCTNGVKTEVHICMNRRCAYFTV